MIKTFHKPVVVISRCLEHAPCRWNSVMITSPVIKNLKTHVEFIPVCPEVEIGLGVPRSPLRIVETGGKRLLVQSETGREVSGEMNSYVSGFLDSLSDIDGFLLKEKSPSCGTKNVRVYPLGSKVSPLTGTGAGFFGKAVTERFSNLAVENEGRLRNQELREHFLTRIFTLAQLGYLIKHPDMKNLVEFHTANKLMLMAYNQKIMRELGRIVSNRDNLPAMESVKKYADIYQTVFTKIPRYTSNINVLMHALGYFSKYLSSGEKQHFLNILELYRLKKVALSAPSAIMNSWIARFDEKYLAGQTFFFPYPQELIDMSDSGR